MKNLLITALSLLITTGVSACTPDASPLSPEVPEQPEDNGNPNENNDDMKIQITIGSTAFTATLADNAAAIAFRAMLPMTVSMSELNGNEKYYYLQNVLTANASNMGTVHTGDLMLYGNNCIVLFYKTFSTSYSYTRLGQIDNTSGLAAALGTGSITVKFETAENE
jgi:hypothetical protein